ncbi:dynein regulatory complex protein 11-like isoform X2 [Daphnia pulex]|nr:dynein regulatory complex protein 11-like isoform X2 [Daphnia pulex]
MLHVQKRRDISAIIRAVLGRVVELKNELASLDFNETPFVGTALAQLKLSPEQVDPPLTLFIDGDRDGNASFRSASETERKQLVQRVLLKLERNPRRQLSADSASMTWDEAVALIQIHERARQGRLRFNLMKQIRQQKMLAGRGLHKLKPAMNTYTAAIKIQNAWRSFLALKRVRQMRHQEMVFLGMVPRNYKENPEIIRAKELENLRTLRQSELEAQYQIELAALRDRQRDKDGAAIRESFLEQIRTWYIDHREQSGKFPDLPAEDEGGSKMIYSMNDGPSETPVPVVVKKKDAAPPMAKTSSSMKRAEEDRPKGVDMAPSQWLENIVHENQKYYDVWRDRAEPGGEVGWDVELLRAQVSEELNDEMRLEADVQARYELDRLRSAYDRDRGRKSKGKRKTARKAAKKSKRGRKEKDLTPDRTLESLVEELVQVGIIRSYPKADIRDFLGSVAVVDPLNRKWKRDTFPGLGDIRSALIEYCILTLGSEEIRKRTPLTRSILLAGPHGSGKSFLMHAICNHIGATLFDISNSSLMGRYPGKAGMTMLIHLITKVSRLLQPSVIVIEDVDRLFMKKSVRMERWDMRRMRKELPKILRAIVPEDRVLLVGTSATPWECDQRNLSQVFQRMIGIPPPDYGTRFTMWDHFIRQATRTAQYTMTPAELTNLARISDSYTPGSIARSVSEILSERRKQLLPRQLLRADEFVSAMARCEPIYKEDEESLRVWYGKTPCRRKRHRNAETEEDDFLAGGGNVKEKKKKKKKKKGSKKMGVKSTKAKKKSKA